MMFLIDAKKIAKCVARRVTLALGAGLHEKLDAIITTQKEIFMNQQDALDALNAVNGTLDKIAVESAASVASIAALTAQLAADQAAGNTISPELEAAINAAAAKVAAVDALVPDAAGSGDTSGTGDGSTAGDPVDGSASGGATTTDPTV